MVACDINDLVSIGRLVVRRFMHDRFTRNPETPSIAYRLHVAVRFGFRHF